MKRQRIGDDEDADGNDAEDVAATADETHQATTRGDDDDEGEEDAVEAEDRDHARMAALLEMLTPEQLSRYEHFRRSHFRRSEVALVMQAALGQSSKRPNEKMTILVGGAAKMFAGELVETARAIMLERNETGSIQPRHVREAYRRMKRQGLVPQRVYTF